jgi:hypothetical protein
LSFAAVDGVGIATSQGRKGRTGGDRRGVRHRVFVVPARRCPVGAAET